MSRFCNVEITNMSETISHRGIVERIEGDIVYVRIIQRSACSGCHAQSMCTASEAKEKIIEITDNSRQFQVNQPVMIYGQSSLGLQAVFLAFVLPLIAVVLAIVIGTNLGWAETISAVIGLLFLVLYYGILYLFRDKLKKRFIFMLKKLN